MDYRDSPEEAAFRAALRHWLKVNAPAGWRSIDDEDEQDRVYRSWHRSLYQAGYMGMAWPVEYGGQGRSPVYDAILNEEVGNTESPPAPGMVNYMGRAVYSYGTAEQKQRFLPTLLNGEVRWCQGFSEPEAGSDLASLRTRAELVGDHYLVNGQKMWTSFGQYGDWCMLLVRTDPDAPKHRGISCLMVSMRTPGITVRPIVIADGKAETCEIFFDNVVVPEDQRIGEPGAGWRIAMTTVSYERGPADIGFISSYRKTLREVEALVAKQGRAADPEVRKELARAYVRGEALRLNAVEQLSLRILGKGPGPEGSIGRLLWTDAEQSLQHLAMDLLGADALTGRENVWLSSYFRSRPVSVYGGSSQIQKNILALQVLGNAALTKEWMNCMPDYEKFQKVLARKDGRLLTLSLNRPHVLNAFGDGMHEELEELVKLVRTDDTVGAILLKGEGRGFSAGGDIKEMAATKQAHSTRAASIFRTKDLLYGMLEIEQPIVAAVHGFAVGLAASIALFCDVVIAAEDAFFADTHVNVGVVAGDGGAVLWPLLLPFGVAKYHLLTGDRISGSDAARMGMVYKAVPADQVLEEATAIANRLASGPPLAIRFTKTAVNQVLRERLNLVLDIGLALSAITYVSEDHREAARAFTEKRDPIFRGD